MGIGKIDATSRQPIEVRRDRLGVPTEEPCPVIHVINDNEQHIRLRRRRLICGYRATLEGDKHQDGGRSQK